MNSIRCVIFAKLLTAMLAAILLLSGCNSLQLSPAVSAEKLIEVPPEFRDQQPRMDFDLLLVDDEMREFVHKNLMGVGSADAKLRRLLRGMTRRGLGQLNYRLDLTYTAQETFHRLKGNCLSFTNLFVALAREAGLKVHYQMVQVPPSWDVGRSGLVILNTHINVLVALRYKPDYLVDFNLFEYQDNYRTELVTDEYAESMFYSNLAVESLQDKNYGYSFWYLNRALTLYPDVPSTWVNLGVLHARLDNLDYAESAYLQALALDNSDKSALTNLSGLYTRQGDVERSQKFAKMVNYYRDRNPYYHFSLANRAFAEGRYPDVLTYLSRSIKLKKKEHQFHYLRGKTLSMMGRDAQAIRSLERALEFAIYKETRERYVQEIEKYKKL